MYIIFGAGDVMGGLKKTSWETIEFMLSVGNGRSNTNRAGHIQPDRDEKIQTGLSVFCCFFSLFLFCHNARLVFQMEWLI